MFPIYIKVKIATASFLFAKVMSSEIFKVKTQYTTRRAFSLIKRGFITIHVEVPLQKGGGGKHAKGNSKAYVFANGGSFGSA